MTDEPSTDQLSYEAASARLEEIVKEGRGLVEHCAAELEAVGRGLEELRLDELVARLESSASGGSA
jgi:exodeoxyribonuclease VII small subunit